MIIRFDYDYYVNGTVLSVVITSLNGINDIVYPHYYTYNYDLEKGSLLTYEEVYTALGYTSDSLEERVSEKISEIINDKMATIQNDSPELRKNMLKLDEIKSLKRNWNGNQAKPMESRNMT